MKNYPELAISVESLTAEVMETGMMALVPRLYPDELIYSFCARYHERMGYRSRESAGRDLFGKTGARVAVAFDFPSGLSMLAAASRWDDWKTVDQMIDSHTLLPFYAPFVSPGILNRARNAMAGAGGGTIHGTLGVLTHNIRLEHFRYCSKCAESDRSKFGEAYWHRLHHLPGIEVCSIHKIFLSETALRTRHRPNAEVFVSAERALEMASANSVRSVEVSDKVHLRLSQDAKWLLDAGVSVGSNSNNRQRYLGLLYAQGFSGYDGPVRLRALIRELRSYYSDELLDHFNCSLGNTHNWITRLIHGMNKSQNPIEHLLLIQFLGVSVAGFFKQSSMRLPFGKGPWPCLNPTCERFRQPAIKQYEKSQTKTVTLQSAERKKMGHPIATFSCTCTCGFSYYRIGPDKSNKSSHHATGFCRITQPWIASFTRCARKTRQLSRLAHKFCTTPKTVELMLKQIDGVLPGNKPRVAVAGEDTAPTTRFLQQRRAKRDRWLKLLSTNKSVPRRKFCNANSHNYRWLVLYDKKWVEKHLPPKRCGKGPGFRTDWIKEDKRMAEQVRREAIRIRATPGKLIRASKTLIARNLQYLHLVIKRGHVVPHTVKTLSEASESVEEFAIRRIRHKAQLLREQGIRASKWKLQLLAAISNDMARRPTVRHTLELCATA